MIPKNLVYVIYDSIKNPVFSGQIIVPILKKLQTDPSLRIHIISFEKDHISAELINELIPQKPNIFFTKFNRLPVLGKISLLHSAYLLKKFLTKDANYSLIARGPLAGWVAMHAINNSCKSFIVQARGLIAIEYELIKPKNNFIDKIRINQFTKIESEIYNPQKKFANFCIGAITPALANYLIKNYDAKKETIKIAQDDFPDLINTNQIRLWRNEIRDFLKITEAIHIYCYNGSAKPWQSLDLTIDFFKNRLKNNSNIFLLILTQDELEFKKILIEQKIEEKYYKIIKVKHNEIYKYLSAADTGLIFRKKHLANWISRPIKAMEYQAIGLKIIHNNTVKWLIDLK